MSKGIEIFDDFPDSLLGSWKIEGNKVKLRIKKEPVTKGYRRDFDYNLHFHFGLRNGDDEKQEIEFHFDCDQEDGLDRILSYLWISSGPGNPYIMTPVEGKFNSGFPRKYKFKLNILPRIEMRIANFYPLDYSSMEKCILEKANQIGGQRVSYGKSVEGKDLYYISLGEISSKPLLVFATGYHPPERDLITIDAIITALIDDALREQVLKELSIILIPFLNPDGFLHSLQGSNVEYMNFHWHFFEGKEGSCIEATALWELCKQLRPVFFMDFHAFTFQSWKARPYLVPKGYVLGKISKKVQFRLEGSLVDLCEGRYAVAQKMLAPDLLATRLRKEIGTITSPKFHINWQDGPGGCRELAIEIFKSVVNAFKASGMLRKEDILLEPYGRVKKGHFTDFYWSVLDAYYFDIRPLPMKILNLLNIGGGEK